LKPQAIRNMTKAEIEQTVYSLKEKLFKMRSEKTTGRIERPERLTIIKKDIARCFTILKEKESEK
jgi:large subunit ribosomal protein L29